MKNTEAEQATILHIDMDAFFASVAERDNPELRGKVVVVGTGPRSVVTSANYAARKFGIRAAMPIGQARRLAPHAIFVEPDMRRYSEVSEKVMEIFRNFTPLVEPISVDEAFLDVAGAKRLLGTPREIGSAIRQKVESQEGITCSVGIASTKLIAKLASSRCKPNGMLEIPPDRTLTFLHPLPINELWGVGEKTAEILSKLGLKTIGDIANTSRATLIRAVGESAGATIYELAWARDYRSIVLNEPEKSIGAEETFSSDLDNQEEILGELLRVTDRATRRLRDDQFMARTISIKVRFGDFTTITRSKTLPLPISATQEIYSQAKALYLALNLERARVRLIGIRLEGLVALTGQPLAAQPELGARDKGWSEVEAAIDAARDRFGGEAVAPARLLKPPDLPGSG